MLIPINQAAGFRYYKPNSGLKAINQQSDSHQALGYAKTIVNPSVTKSTVANPKSNLLQCSEGLSPNTLTIFIGPKRVENLHLCKWWHSNGWWKYCKHHSVMYDNISRYGVYTQPTHGASAGDIVPSFKYNFERSLGSKVYPTYQHNNLTLTKQYPMLLELVVESKFDITQVLYKMVLNCNSVEFEGSTFTITIDNGSKRYCDPSTIQQ